MRASIRNPLVKRRKSDLCSFGKKTSRDSLIDLGEASRNAIKRKPSIWRKIPLRQVARYAVSKRVDRRLTGYHDSASDVFASEVLDATCLERTPSSWQDFTVLQAEILAWVEQCMDERGVVPSVNDILYRSPFQYSRALSRALDRLLANNWLNLPTQGEGVVTSSTPLSRAASKPRSTTALISVPIVGERDAANSLSAPHAAPEGLMEAVLPNGMRRCHGFLKIPATLFYLKPTYLVRVETNAMSAVGIVAGDMVAVQQRGVAWPGQVIVARIEGEVQIRRLGEASPSGLAPLSLRLNDKQEENGENQRVRTMASETVTLFPENPTYRPSVVMRDDLEIKGVMIGVIKASTT